jgi:heme-degrading monooxygenase HmoA
MIAAMAEFTGPVTGLDEISRIAGEAIEGWLRDYEGYRGLVMLAHEETQVSRVITFWDSHEAEASTRRGRQSMREQIAASVGLEVVDYRVWEVPVYELAPGEPATS